MKSKIFYPYLFIVPYTYYKTDKMKIQDLQQIKKKPKSDDIKNVSFPKMAEYNKQTNVHTDKKKKKKRNCQTKQ